MTANSPLKPRPSTCAAGKNFRGSSKRGDFTAKAGETWLLTDLEGIRAERVLLVGLGAKGRPPGRTTSRARPGAAPSAAAICAATRTRVTSLALALPRPAAKALSDERLGRAVAELAGHTLYRVNDLKSAKKPRAHALARVVVAAPAKAAPAVKKGFAQGSGARRVAPRSCATSPTCPAMSARPPTSARPPQVLAKTHKSLKVKVLGLPEIKREKMGCFLAVTQGSEEPPRFIVIEHRHPRAKGAPVVLVGKGITFDTGGISLKDPPTMDEMKFDMSGAACVIGTMKAVAELNLPLNVVGIVAACENMPDGRAIKPGDIVTSAAGLTVEILNTDAEGRLILCDALHYARRFKPDVVIDMATLTGAIVVALGVHHTGVFSNNDALARELVDCGARRSTTAPGTCRSPRNTASSSRATSPTWPTSRAAMAARSPPPRSWPSSPKDLTWAHLDIAGTAYQGGAGKGSTGRPSAHAARVPAASRGSALID